MIQTLICQILTVTVNDVLRWYDETYENDPVSKGLLRLQDAPQ